MEERYIASVDLGTYKLAVCVARVLEQNVEVIYYKESPSDGIRYSYVMTPGKVKANLRVAISEAQQALRIKIHQVIVGLPRWYVRQETAAAEMERLEPDSLIQQSEIRTLKSIALESYPLDNADREVIYGAVAQSFSTEDCINEAESDIVGMAANTLEGNFKVFIGNRRHSSNIDSIFSDLGIAIAKKYFTPGITARAVLNSEQMETGVALMDIGAGVSSVTIFKGSIMRFYAAIPFGGNSLTNDIKSECNFSFNLAENIKKAYGACMPNKLSSLGEKIIQIINDDGEAITQVSVKYISEIITARMKEIIEALLFKIQESGFSSEENLKAGVIVTGGCSELVNCANFIKELSGYSVKIGRPRRIFSCEGCPEASEASAATSMGMILSAKDDRSLNCVNDAVGIFSKPTTETVSQARKEPEIAKNEAEVIEPAEPRKPAVTTNIAEPEESGVLEEPIETEAPEEPKEPIETEEPHGKDAADKNETHSPEVTYDPYSQPGRSVGSQGPQESEGTDTAQVDDEKKDKDQHDNQSKLKWKGFKILKEKVKETIGGLYNEMNNEDV